MVGVLTSLKAQNFPVIRMDPHQGGAVQNVPFDHFFYLLLPVDSTLQLDELAQLDLFKIRGRRKSPSQPQVHIKTYFVKDLKKAYFVDSIKEAGIKYLKVFIDTQFLPNTRFYVLLTLKPSHDFLGPFNKINQSLSEGDFAQAQKDYSKLATGLSVKNSSAQIGWPTFSTYQKYFQDSLQDLYRLIAVKDTALLHNIDTLKGALRASGIRITSLFECNCQKDFVANELFSDSTKFLIPLQNLMGVPKAEVYFATGRLNIQDFEPYDIADVNDLAKRVSNLKKLKTALINISYFYHLSSFADKMKAAIKDSIYNSVLLAAIAIDNMTKTLGDADARIRQALNNMTQLGSAQISFGGTSPSGEDIQTTSGHYIIADFGLAAAGTLVNNKYSTVLRPYLGVNFSFIAIDKSQPLSNVENRRVLHHLSAVLGLTTTPLTRQGSYDLIKSMSLVAGIAIRINRAIRITAGTLVYERDNVNPVLPAVVTFGPMLAVSLDLEVSKWFGDLKGKLY